MAEYTQHDFENAKFATHPDGNFAARLYPSEVETWFTWSEGAYTDMEMVDDGWIPVLEKSKKLSLTENEYKIMTRNASPEYKNGFDGALILFDIPVVSTNKDRLIEHLENAIKNGELFPVRREEVVRIAEILDRQGVKANVEEA